MHVSLSFGTTAAAAALPASLVSLDASFGSRLDSAASLEAVVLWDVAFFFSLDRVEFSEGNLGRDFRSGFLTWATGGGVFATLPFENFSSKLSLLGRAMGASFSSDSAVDEVFFRPSLGDLALVVGIYIENCLQEGIRIAVKV